MTLGCTCALITHFSPCIFTFVWYHRKSSAQLNIQYHEYVMRICSVFMHFLLLLVTTTNTNMHLLKKLISALLTSIEMPYNAADWQQDDSCERWRSNLTSLPCIFIICLCKPKSLAGCHLTNDPFHLFPSMPFKHKMKTIYLIKGHKIATSVTSSSDCEQWFICSCNVATLTFSNPLDAQGKWKTHFGFAQVQYGSRTGRSSC